MQFYQSFAQTHMFSNKCNIQLNSFNNSNLLNSFNNSNLQPSDLHWNIKETSRNTAASFDLYPEKILLHKSVNKTTTVQCRKTPSQIN